MLIENIQQEVLNHAHSVIEFSTDYTFGDRSLIIEKFIPQNEVDEVLNKVNAHPLIKSSVYIADDSPAEYEVPGSIVINLI